MNDLKDKLKRKENYLRLVKENISRVENLINYWKLELDYTLEEIDRIKSWLDKK